VLHTAYSFALDFEADLVAKLLDRLVIDDRSRILDPFCGTGTTVLESKLQGLCALGIDANPVCVLVSRAKTDWRLNASEIRRHARSILGTARTEYGTFLLRYDKERAVGRIYRAHTDPIFARSPAGMYLVSSGLIRRGWISPRPALKALLVAEGAWKLPKKSRNFLLLSLLGLLVPKISNMSYGPEIYRARRRTDCDVFAMFEKRTAENLEKIEMLQSMPARGRSHIYLGDSTSNGLNCLEGAPPDIVISSPPYLSDHDYSRMTRLELVYSGHLASAAELRMIKGRLLRSSSKNVYKGDSLSEHVKRFSDIRLAVERVAERAAEHKSGFARIYPRLIGEYFGGMYKHFQGLGKVLRRGGQIAYIVGDQSSFFAVPIPTAKIIAQVAEGCGANLRLIGMEPVRKYRGTRGAVTWTNQEWLVLLKKR
jgi:hypothetical protein